MPCIAVSRNVGQWPVDLENPIQKCSLTEGLMARFLRLPQDGGQKWRNLADLTGATDGTLNGSVSATGFRPQGTGATERRGGQGSWLGDGSAGTGQVSCGNVPVGGLTTFSVSVWTYALNTGGGNFGRIVTKSDVSVFALLVQGSTAVAFYINASSVTSSAVWSLNKWHHVCGTYVSGATGGQKIYVDGVLAGSATVTGALTANANPVIIGAGAANRVFGGYLDDLSVYNRALSAAEVPALVDDSARGSPTTLRHVSTVAWFLPTIAKNTNTPILLASM